MSDACVCTYSKVYIRFRLYSCYFHGDTVSFHGNGPVGACDKMYNQLRFKDCVKPKACFLVFPVDPRQK